MSRYTEPEWPSAALVTIDTQCDTLDGQPFEVAGTSSILPRMKALVEAFRDADRPIVHIVRLYKADGSNADPCRKELAVTAGLPLLEGSPGSQLAPELLPHPGIELDAELLLSGGVQTLAAGEVAIFKPRWGAFYKTTLEEYLRDRGVSTIVFSGCNFPNCPRTSIYEASERDFRIVVVDDAVSGLHGQGKKEMQGIGINVLSARQVIHALRGGTVSQRK